MAKPKPKGWNSMSKAKQDAWKKANFDSSTKVTEAQLAKLRQAGTPTKAITKYANDPSMREALNRFYGKDKVNAVKQSPAATGSGTKVPPRGGPGAKMTPRPSGGPGAKMTARDGRSSTAVKKSAGPSVGKQAAAAVGATAIGGAAVRAITMADKKKKVAGKHAATAVAKGKAKGRHVATAASKTAKTVGKHKATKVAGSVLGKTPVGRAVTLGLMASGIKKSPAPKHKAPAKNKTKSGKQG
jgi:hypothetical protein